MAQRFLSYSTLFVAILLIILLHYFGRIEPLVASLSTNDHETRRIRNICSETLEPFECFKCITADPSRDSNDTPELIHSLLYCLYSEANGAHVNADLLSQNATIPILKNKLSRCSSLLFDAANLAVDAMSSMESNKYVQAWDFSKTARRSIFGCAKQFLGETNPTIPSSVLQHMIPAKHLYDSMHILFQLIVR
ncbi:hypothetical protein SOVF_026870 [Spinacia oleracea]|nr:hypothetical protein SOVF_026870 [Spinacia oleracea]